MIKVSDIAYVRFSAPDLDEMERFLGDFGLAVTERRNDVLYARGSDTSPWIHSTVRGEPGFVAVAFEAASAADLEAASKLDGGSPVEPVADPGCDSPIPTDTPSR
jgi:hypothetical protein